MQDYLGQPNQPTGASECHVVVGGLGHRQHAGAEMVDVEAVQLELQHHRPDVGPEAHERVRRGTDPVADVLSVRQRGRQTDDPALPNEQNKERNK